MKHPSLEIVVGLPGSGKTTYLQKLLAAGTIDEYFDDYQRGAPEEDKSNPRTSPNYQALRTDIEAGKRVAIADICYCKTDEFELVSAAMQADFPELKISSTFFANDPKACAHNVRSRNREQHLETELQFIADFSPAYNPPQNQTVPVIMG